MTFTDGTDTKTFAQAVTAGWIAPFAYAYDPATGYVSEDIATGAIDPWTGYWIDTLVGSLTMILPLDTPYVPVVPTSLGSKALPAGVTPPPPPNTPMVSASMLQFGNDPNPVRDVHTTTFAVKGVMASLVQAIKVEIYDQSGRLVYTSGEIQGVSVDWHTNNNYGDYLANGVYLYRMYALVNGKWIVSQVKKLAIVR